MGSNGGDILECEGKLVRTGSRTRSSGRFEGAGGAGGPLLSVSGFRSAGGRLRQARQGPEEGSPHDDVGEGRDVCGEAAECFAALAVEVPRVFPPSMGRLKVSHLNFFGILDEYSREAACAAMYIPLCWSTCSNLIVTRKRILEPQIVFRRKY